MYVSTFLSNQVNIDTHTNIKITQSIFLNIQLGSDSHMIFLMNFCHKIVIARRVTHNQITYAIKFIIQIIKLVGSITAKITQYVGLQLLNTGPRENQTNISHIIPFLFQPLVSILFDFSVNHNLRDKLFHIFGKIVITQNPIIIIALNHFRNIWSTHKKIVDTFNNSENIIIDTDKEIIIINGFNLSL